MFNRELVRSDSTVTLAEGRKLGFAEYGAQNGKPVLYFHGAPGSSHIHADMAEMATQRNVRLVAVDRPGYGLSDADSKRTLLSWASDIASLMDELGVAHFSIVGFSGGSPYALACAYQLKERVKKVALVAPLAPLDGAGVMQGMSPMASGLYALAQNNPDELRKTFCSIAPTAAALLGAMSASAGEWDKGVLLDRAAEFEFEYTHTLRQGIEGAASDFIVNSASWGFPINNIHTEVHLYSGTLDQNTPPAMTHFLAAQLQNSQTFVLPDEGHFVLYGHWSEILQRLV